MKRIYAVGVLAALSAVLLWAVPRGGTLTGSWEAAVDLGGQAAPENTAFLRYTFDGDGTYTFTVAFDRAGLADGARVQGRYWVRGDRLYTSESLDYEIELDVYDRYRLEGDELTLLENSANQMNGFYPLTLTRVED